MPLRTAPNRGYHCLSHNWKAPGAGRRQKLSHHKFMPQEAHLCREISTRRPRRFSELPQLVSAGCAWFDGAVSVCAFRLKYSTKEDILSGTLYLSKAPTGCFSSRGFPNQFLLTVQLSDPCSAFSGARCLLPWHLLAVCLIN